MDADARSLVTGKICPACQFKYSPDLERCPEDNSLLAVVRRDPFIGRLIADKYKIVEILGMGGFSTVYKAEQTSLRRAVAVKILHAEFVDKPDKIRRFQHEAESISTLVHANVATVYDYGVLSEGQPYLVMEVAQGKTLSAVLAQQKPLDSERAVAIFLQTCDGIAAAHGKGLIHRDIKPSNIILTEENGAEHVKILDFGLAKVISEGDGVRENLTMTGEVLGTPAYMAPEQCMGTAMDMRTDIYSFGCVMYEVLSGKLPLEGDTSYEVMNKHINEVPLTLSKSGGPSVPPRLVRIVAKTLQKDPDDRYQNFEDLKDALLGVEPSISTELRAILFSGANARLSKKKKSLKKKVFLTVWSLALFFSSLGGLLTFEYFDRLRKADIEKQYANKIAKFNCATVAFDYPAIFAPVDKKIDFTALRRFENRVNPAAYFELKLITLNLDVPATAAAQREVHKAYRHFVEIKPIQKLDFGKGKLLHGYDTEFVTERFEGLSKERHIYWGTKGAVWKIKLNYPATKDTKDDKIYDIILDTVRFRPEAPCSLSPQG